MDAQKDSALSQSQHLCLLLLASQLCDWLVGAELQRKRESDRRIRQKKLSAEDSSGLSVSLPVASLPRSPLLPLSVLLLLLVRPCCFPIPGERGRFNAMDLLPTDCCCRCCLHRGIMGAVVSSAAQEDS